MFVDIVLNKCAQIRKKPVAGDAFIYKTNMAVFIP